MCDLNIAPSSVNFLLPARKNLESTAVSLYRTMPAYKIMQSSAFYNLSAREVKINCSQVLSLPRCRPSGLCIIPFTVPQSPPA